MATPFPIQAQAQVQSQEPFQGSNHPLPTAEFSQRLDYNPLRLKKKKC
jgi:hypothetical protein